MKKIPDFRDIKKEMLSLKKRVDSDFEEEVEKLKDEIVIITPVDTGFLKSSFQNVMKISDFKYKIINTANYSESILIDGKSQQLPHGIIPHIKNWQNKLKR